MTRPLPAPRPIGWPLLPLPDAQGRLRYPTLEESVREMIEVILRTRPGEQLMRPDFGAGLDRFLHEPNTTDTRRRIRELVAASIARWESRALLDRVEVDEVPGRPSHVRVDIAYRLRRTGVPQKIGFTMELGG
ncbi:GPW/gp25 family protein [Sorangium sp. So ce385]|uniref:GPW/gp25 family protein n=1 Tax=Sorangium sp. So ce385 TaxID=3133308 RepID=UPI003F5C8B0E